MTPKQHSITSIMVFFMLLTVNMNGQVLQWEWVKGINSDDGSRVHDLVVDQSDNSVYIAGQFYGDLSAVFSSGPSPTTDLSTSNGLVDGFVAKYSAEGSIQWAFKLGGPDLDAAKAIDIDALGNIYVSGYAGVGDCNVSGTSMPDLPGMWLNSAKSDFFIAKFNPDGEFVWLRYSSSDLGDFTGADISVTLDAVYAIGNFDDVGSFGSLDSLKDPSLNDIFLVKYDLDGNEQWAAESRTNFDDYGRAVIADDTSVYILGDFSGSNLAMFHASGNSFTTIANTSNGVSAIVLASDNSTGQMNWAERIASDFDDNAMDITSTADSLFLTGGIQNNANFPSFSANPVLSSGNQDIFLSAHSKADGSTGWVEVIPCTHSANQKGRALTADADGHIYFAGTFDEDIEFPGPSVLSSIGAEECFFASYTVDGTFRWARRMGSADDDDANGIALGYGQTIYTAGKYLDAFDAGPLNLPDFANNNGFLVKLKEIIPPGNEDPCSALQILVNDSCSPRRFTNELASNSGIPDPGCGSFISNDLWFKTVVPPSGNVFLSVNTGDREVSPSVEGNMWNPAMAVYSGSCNSLLKEGCFAENAAANFRGANAFMRDMIPGDTLWIRVWEIDGDENGYFTICAFDPGAFPGWTLSDIPCDNMDEIDLDTTLTKTKKGWGFEVIGFSGTTQATEILGSNDGIGAEFLNDGDWLVLEFEDIIPKGEAYYLYIKTRADTLGISKVNIFVSKDNVNYKAHSFRPETMVDVYTRLAIIAEEETKYIGISNTNAGGGGFLIDAIEYIFSATKGGTWSGPGVTGSIFNPLGQTASVSIKYSVGINTNLSDSIITVKVKTSPKADPGSNAEICGTTINLEATLSEGGTGLWEMLSGPATVGFNPSNTDPRATMQVDAYGTYVLRWTETKDDCSDDSTIMITFWEMPIPSERSGEMVCGLSAQLEAVPSIGTGSWQQTIGPGTSSFRPSNTVPDPRIEVSQHGSYLFIWEELNGPCIQESARKVEFFEALNANAGEDIFLINEYQTYIKAEEPVRGNGIWELHYGTGIIEDPYQTYTLVSELSPGNNEIKWTVREESRICPEVSDTLLIMVEEVEEVEESPTVITPNGDGQNDRLIFPKINDITRASIRIFNRWGGEVFYSENYTNNWEGQDKKGRDLLPDTYFYILIIEGGNEEKGFIEIRR